MTGFELPIHEEINIGCIFLTGSEFYLTAL